MMTLFPIKFYDMKEVRRLFHVNAVITSIDAIRPKDFYFSGEMHDFWEVVCLLDGSISATADERVYQLSAGQVLFHKPLEFHRIWSTNDTSPHVIIFSFDASGEGMRFFENKLFTIDENKIEEIKDLQKKVSAALEEAEKNGLNSDSYIFASQKAANAIENFLLSLYNTAAIKHTAPGNEDCEDYKKIVRVMHENADKNLTVADIAALCNMSVSSLKKKFSLFSDKGVGKYFTYVKMRKAITMLCNGVSAPEISDALGFSSVNYFYAAFKREIGLTPKEYLSQTKNEIGG
ncbi:MAG TPA: AraC family transcriptional regulator [Bacillota bacterium]|nr:AraC family transcriptional regulator [Bacillota bacterium]HOK68685.1 AraC family transcriptional regulator [Bacillota bacterium]HPP85369.1 AraC family transcriptional regulator [Bacillota bacterium]